MRTDDLKGTAQICATIVGNRRAVGVKNTHSTTDTL